MQDVNPEIRRTGGLVWIWQQPPKLQAGGSNPLLFANYFIISHLVGFAIAIYDPLKSVISDFSIPFVLPDMQQS